MGEPVGGLQLRGSKNSQAGNFVTRLSPAKHMQISPGRYVGLANMMPQLERHKPCVIRLNGFLCCVRYAGAHDFSTGLRCAGA